MPDFTPLTPSEQEQLVEQLERLDERLGALLPRIERIADELGAPLPPKPRPDHLSVVKGGDGA
jgi:hypothetical protein